MGRLTVRLALAAHRFFLDHRHSGPIHFARTGPESACRRRRADPAGWLCRISSLLTLSDIFSDRFRRALHSLGGHFQAGQDLHLLAAVIEGGILAHHRLHAAHAGREFRVLDVQFHIGRKLA